MAKLISGIFLCVIIDILFRMFIMYIGDNIISLLMSNVFDVLYSIFIFIFLFALIYRYSGDSWKNIIKESLKTFGLFFLAFFYLFFS